MTSFLKLRHSDFLGLIGAYACILFHLRLEACGSRVWALRAEEPDYYAWVSLAVQGYGLGFRV